MSRLFWNYLRITQFQMEERINASELTKPVLLLNGFFSKLFSEQSLHSLYEEPEIIRVFRDYHNSIQVPPTFSRLQSLSNFMHSAHSELFSAGNIQQWEISLGMFAL